MDDDDKGDFQQYYEEIQEELNNLQYLRNDLESIKQKILVFEKALGVMLRKLQ